VVCWLNPAVRRDGLFEGLFEAGEYRDVEAYYASQPQLDATPLRRAPELAAYLGIDRVDVKDESHRFGLAAFKILGARFAAHRLGRDIERGVVAATAGNHGRALARVARDHAVPCTIFVPSARGMGDVERATRERRVAGMSEDGATVVEVDGSYEDAVRLAAAHGETTGATLVSDVSWPGYETIPRWIMAGYTHLVEEAAGQWERPPDIVFVQGGVGGLVCAAVSWLANRFGPERPFVVACEPERAACLLESARAGAPVTIGGDLATMMAGLRCATPSSAAWPAIRHGVDAFLSVPDALAIEAMQRLGAEDSPIEAGPSGACGIAAAIAAAHDAALAALRHACGWSHATRAFAIVTEGP
jgi:diaminopropionate ammonia-lyase